MKNYNHNTVENVMLVIATFDCEGTVTLGNLARFGLPTMGSGPFSSLNKPRMDESVSPVALERQCSACASANA